MPRRPGRAHPADENGRYGVRGLATPPQGGGRETRPTARCILRGYTIRWVFFRYAVNRRAAAWHNGRRPVRRAEAVGEACTARYRAAKSRAAVPRAAMPRAAEFCCRCPCKPLCCCKCANAGCREALCCRRAREPVGCEAASLLQDPPAASAELHFSDLPRMAAALLQGTRAAAPCCRAEAVGEACAAQSRAAEPRAAVPRAATPRAAEFCCRCPCKPFVSLQVRERRVPQSTVLP